MTAFWDVTPCSLEVALMEAVPTSETSVNFYETTRRNIPQGCQLHTRRRENLKSQLGKRLALNLVHGKGHNKRWALRAILDRTLKKKTRLERRILWSALIFQRRSSSHITQVVVALM
jgi:hypothetical protein